MSDAATTITAQLPEVAVYMKVLEQSTGEWRGMLGTDVTPAQLVHQAYAGAHSIGAVLLHMADSEAIWTMEVLEGGAVPAALKEELLADQTDVWNGKWPVVPSEPLAYYYEKQDRVREHTLRVLAGLTDIDKDVSAWGNTFTIRWILGHMVSHDSQHGGQAILLHVAQTLRP
jgi:uncharacterized damage-inducible protein DinB